MIVKKDLGVGGSSRYRVYSNFTATYDAIGDGT